MPRIDTVIIGGGQAGLAMSRCLSDRSVEHVVLERGRVGERWRSQRWDSLTLLTPRWLSRIADWSDGGDPDGYMSRMEVIDYLERYACAFDAPVHTGVTVLSVRRRGALYRVVTDRGTWVARNVVIATGESQAPFVPGLARHLPRGIEQVVSTRYRNPDGLAAGGVLVVGASATGAQLAAEIHASGRPVTLSVGRHTRLPRTYRGRDILSWFHDMGVLAERASEVANLAASRGQPSMQLTGSSDRRTLDLRVLQESGVRLVGRAASADGSRVSFDDDAVESIAAAEVKLARVRLRIDSFVAERGIPGVPPPDPFRPVPLPDTPDSIDLAARGISTVVWATGFRRSYPWLQVPVLDARGEIVHDGGITAAAGLYVLGLNFLRRRSSSFLSGVGRDAADLAEHIVARRVRRLDRHAVAWGT